jgi:hypothetical protein
MSLLNKFILNYTTLINILTYEYIYFLHTHKTSRLGQRHDLKSITLTTIFIKLFVKN